MVIWVPSEVQQNCSKYCSDAQDSRPRFTQPIDLLVGCDRLELSTDGLRVSLPTLHRTSIHHNSMGWGTPICHWASFDFNAVNLC